MVSVLPNNTAIGSGSTRSLGEAVSGKPGLTKEQVFAAYITQLASAVHTDPTVLAMMAIYNPGKIAKMAHDAGMGPPPAAALGDPSIEAKAAAKPPPAPAPAPAPATTNPLPGSTEIPPRTPHEETMAETNKTATGPGKDKSEEFDTSDGAPKKSGTEKIGEAILAGLTGIKAPPNPEVLPGASPPSPTQLRPQDPMAGVPVPQGQRTLRGTLGSA